MKIFCKDIHEPLIGLCAGKVFFKCYNNQHMTSKAGDII